MIHHKTLNHIGTAILISGILLVPMKFIAAYVPLFPIENICIVLGILLMSLSRLKWEQKVKLPSKWQQYLTQV
ncbi:MAG: hypothetical protein RLZZ628_3684 [Bacteroidota bacterium]|jgi:hypothetical protein